MANPRGIDPTFTVSAISGGIRVYNVTSTVRLKLKMTLRLFKVFYLLEITLVVAFCINAYAIQNWKILQDPSCHTIQQY